MTNVHLPQVRLDCAKLGVLYVNKSEKSLKALPLRIFGVQLSRNFLTSKANPDRLVRLILLIALAMTSAWLQGQRTKLQRQSLYVYRTQEKGRTKKRHSNFWIGLYGQNWITAFHECQIWVEEFMGSIRNKQRFYRQGLKAMSLIQQAL